MKTVLPIKNAQLFCEGLDHPECLDRHPDGSWYAGGEAGQIYKIDSQGKKIQEVAHSGGFILGIRISKDGKTLYACDLKKKCLWALDLTKKKSKLKILSASLKLDLQIPNHLCFLNQRTLLVTDSGSPQKKSGRILWFDLMDPKKFGVWHPGPFAFSNGIAFDPRRKLVFVVCSLLPGVECFEVTAENKVGKRIKSYRFPKTVPDGIAIRADGTVYVSCYTPNRIYQINPHGKTAILIDDWFGHTLASPTNIVLFGKAQNRMMVANLGRWHLSEILL